MSSSRMFEQISNTQTLVVHTSMTYRQTDVSFILQDSNILNNQKVGQSMYAHLHYISLLQGICNPWCVWEG